MKPLIIALDVETDKEALSLIKATKKCADIYKVGPTLVLRYGPKIFEKIRKQGRKVFLDLKFHDIPVQAAGACRSAADMGVWMLNVHASGGAAMMEAAAEAVARCAAPPLLIGVSVLTSLDVHPVTQREEHVDVRIVLATCQASER